MTVNCFHKMLHHSFLAGFWMSHVLSMQGFSIYLGSQCHKVLNIQEFWISQFSENASSSQQGSDYIRILNMSMFLICYFTQGPELSGYVWICLNICEYAIVISCLPECVVTLFKKKCIVWRNMRLFSWRGKFWFFL